MDARESFRHKTLLTRREVLRLGGASGLALTLSDFLRCKSVAQPAASRTFGQARSVIVLYLHGGHAQQETWDPKPDGPLPERGEFGAIATSVPGVRFGELLPRSAQIAHKLAIIRSMSHANANHVQASMDAMTGQGHPPQAEARGDFAPSVNDFPPFGAVVSRLRAHGQLPPWVQIGPLMRRNNGTILHGQSPGFLGPRYSPLAIDQPLLPGDVRIEAVASNPTVPVMRLNDRGRLLEQVEQQRRQLDQAAEVQTFDAFHRQAFNILSSSETARAFNLAAEPGMVRARYGATEFGQRCLLARRLAEAGVPIVNVHFCHTPDGSWDTHGRHFSQMKNSLCPTFDQAFSALVEDLDQRGLLGQTLVLATAEFGRTPRVNNAAGRDHWPWVYSIALAGAGTRPGTVYGSSDGIAAHPTANPHDPRDLAATVYHLLGVPPDTLLHDQTNRPHALVIGRPIDGVLA
ncbi:MAG: DUF1501 domain-containing protein [Gemmataceae bacterium]|nr:DUF1501 domain-containing protein [Gemmataceae bacterium]